MLTKELKEASSCGSKEKASHAGGELGLNQQKTAIQTRFMGSRWGSVHLYDLIKGADQICE